MAWRWIPPITADGSLQMAIDSWMFQQLLAGGPPMLRLYRWSRPTVSLGRHQQRWPAHWRRLQEQGQIDLVRRPTGGRAVLHAGAITYALVQRSQQRRRGDAYRHACQWLQLAFANVGEPLHFGAAAAASLQQRSNCFGTATTADLVTSSGSKRIGSAQCWQGEVMLQHGSILLDPPAGLWQELFGVVPPALAALPVTWAQWERCLRDAARDGLCGGALMAGCLSPKEWGAVLALQRSPLASTTRATEASPMPRG